MRRQSLLLALLVACVPAYSQRPSDPALLVPHEAPSMNYAAVENPLSLPPDVTMGAPANLAFDSRGNLLVLARGPKAFFEFDPNGRFVRAFGDNLFTRAHGLRIDSEGNLWATDVGGHTVVKLDNQGRVLLTLGEKGQPGDWNDQSRKLNEPNDVLIAPNGDIFVAQGHTPGAMGDPRVLKFDKDGKFIKSWGGKGKGPGQFDVAHGLAMDPSGRLWVTDRENQRIQIFDSNGQFVKALTYAGLPCGIVFTDRYIYMANGFAGQILRMDLDGRVLATVGKTGRGVGLFGEAHYVAVSPKGEIFVADSVNGSVQKFVSNTN